MLYRSNPMWDSGAPPKELVELVEDGSIKPCRILDVGSGRGHTVRYLQSKGFDAWGIDLSSVAHQQASEYSKKDGLPPNYIHGDIFEYTPIERFSLIVDIGFFHIYPKEKRRYLVDQLYRRLLTEEGTLLLWCLSDEEPDWGGAYRIPQRELTSLFSDYWEIVQLHSSQFTKSGNKAFFMQAQTRKI